VLVEMPAMTNGDECADCADYGNYSFYLPWSTGCIYSDYFDDDVCCGGAGGPSPDFKWFKAVLTGGQCRLTLMYTLCDPRDPLYWEQHFWQSDFSCPIATLNHDLTYDASQYNTNIGDGHTVCVATGTTVHVESYS
jgi:hypothetical protein